MPLRPFVLLVEDHQDTREMYVAGLQHAGFAVFAFADPQEALATALPQIDLVVLDYSMPKMTGADLALRLKAAPSTQGAKFVLMSGHGPSAVRDSAQKMHFDAMLQKPLAPDQLSRILKHLLKR